MNTSHILTPDARLPSECGLSAFMTSRISVSLRLAPTRRDLPNVTREVVVAPDSDRWSVWLVIHRPRLIVAHVLLATHTTYEDADSHARNERKERRIA